MSDYFRSLIDKAGGAQEFAKEHDWNPKAIEDYYNGTRKMKEVTVMAIATKLELWRELIKEKQ